MGNCVGGKGLKKDPKVLTEEEIKLLLDNTHLSRPQIIALHRNFLKECPTGKLTKKDFIKLFKEVHPSENKREKADKFCEYVFKVIDKNNLGYISFPDFVLCFSLTSDGDFRQKCEFAFKLYDLDKDGKISKKEMTQVLTALYDLSGITDRKKNNAPAKKVEEIIKKINATYQPPAAAAAAADQPASSAPASPAAGDDKKGKKDDKKKDSKDKKTATKENKKPKEEKKKEPTSPKKEKPVKSSSSGPEYITKEQFIDACTQDETLKKLFVDSIFCNQGDCSETTNAALNNLGSSSNAHVSVEAPSVSLSGPSLSFTAPSLKLAAPSISVNAEQPAAEHAEAKAEVHTNSVHLELSPPQLSVNTTSSEENNNNNNTAEVNGVYNIREETNYVTSIQKASPLGEVSVSAEVSTGGENKNEADKPAAETA